MSAPTIPSTGDPELDYWTMRLAGPFDSLLQRQIAQREAEAALSDRPNRIDGSAR